MSTPIVDKPEIILPTEGAEESLRPTFIGPAIIGGKVTVALDDGTVLGSVDVMSSGQWQVPSLSSWEKEEYQVKARQNVEGVDSEWTELRTFTVVG
ncbi:MULTISPECIES: hypothetical protein [unclassified Pseudomonas]|uniref:hypothetical protein n=1 Tax=unclassified Pseudomonas TaxID=196821 RepID=UPI001CBF628F|nr:MULTISPECIES: hypothetical protein [unclassified Pseudomonas]